VASCKNCCNQPTVSSSGRRIPGLRPHDSRLLAVLQTVLCFMHLAGKACFKTAAPFDRCAESLDWATGHSTNSRELTNNPQ
jgi:hypothetical protein